MTKANPGSAENAGTPGAGARVGSETGRAAYSASDVAVCRSVPVGRCGDLLRLPALRQDRTPSGPEPAAAATKPKATNPIQKYIEVVGIRLTTDAKKKPVAKFLIVNHASTEVANLGGNVTLWASTSRSEEDSVGSFKFHVDSIGPYESKEVSAPFTTKLKIYELPDWQNATAGSSDHFAAAVARTRLRRASSSPGSIARDLSKSCRAALAWPSARRATPRLLMAWASRGFRASACPNSRRASAG